MSRRPHSRLAAAQGRSAERMREAAQQLRGETGPIKPEVRAGLVRLLEAVADQHGQASVYVWDNAANVANSLLAGDLATSIVEASTEERAGRERNARS